ncbi:MAG: peptidoglycan DD-metalloendopeptidase family protein [Candidatus Pelagibacter bacterium]|nr:peptidoglycan DD-metalloendopeptidase family protein [Candidatus Pelagibacter bacterium]MBL6861059.1 peptidoglycan DD-metalloendopeptidase family protein [Candidatus Pelagibacter bacterium]
MTIIQKISIFTKNKLNFFSFFGVKSLQVKGNNLFVLIAFLIFFSTLFFLSSNFIKKKNDDYSNNLKEITKETEFSNLTNYLISKINSPYEEIDYVIKNNDTVEKILKKFKVRSEEIGEISVQLKVRKLANIYSGRKLSLILKKLENGSNTIVNLVYPINNTTSVEIRKSQNSFEVKENILQLNRKEVVVRNVITNNLYSSAIDSGIEPNIIVEFARIFGFEVDFQRDIRQGDWFEILYEKFEDDNNQVRDTGKIIYASMFVNGEEINLYNFRFNNSEDFYDIKGKSITKSLMKTPINGARLSSSFGMRKHPILGYNKMHRGTDFAAPSGTPIMASGSGTVTRARWCGGGGNCVKIKHNSTYETIYAHMKSFAKGIREGRKVKQGQIIGYVGSTGLSTGPHLHYEVLVNGKKVNSQRLKLPSGKTLSGEERNQFELDRIKIDLKLANLR